MEMAKLKPKKKEESKPAVPKFVPLKPDPEAYANFGKAPPVESDDQKRMRAEIIAKQKAAAAAAAGGGMHYVVSDAIKDNYYYFITILIIIILISVYIFCRFRFNSTI